MFDINITRGDIKGWVGEDIFHLLPPRFFEDPVRSAQDMGGSVIKESRRRWAAILTLPNGQRVFLKRDRTKGWPESLKYVFSPSKGRKEWFMAHQLKERNLSIPKPFGWMERIRWGFVKESYYLSEAIGSGTSLIDDPLKLGEGSSIDELARIVRKIHDSGLFHEDLHAGNFLWDGQSLFLTDLHRGKIIRSLSLKQRLWNLSQLFHSLRSGWGEVERLRFIEKYFESKRLPFERRGETLRKIRSLMDHLQKRQWKSRTKRCLKESTEFSVQKEKGIYYYHHRDFPLDRLKKVIGEHLSLISERPSALAKLSSEVIVSLVNDGKGKVGVKHLRYSHFRDIFKNFFRPSKGLRAWIAGNGLMTREIPSLKPLALLEQRNWWGLGESYFVMEASEKGMEMDRYILRRLGDFRRKRLFVKHFAQWLSHLHRKNLYHRDIKTCNILVSENGETWDFHLLDLEDVRLDEKVDEKRLFKNLLQLNTSIPKTITRTDRLRFLKEYIHHQPVIRDDRHFINRLMKKSRERGVVYVSPQGVVEER